MPCVCSVRKDLANCHFSLVCLLSRFSVIKQRIHVGMNKSAEFSPTWSGFVCLDFVAHSFLGNRQLRKPQNKVLQQVAPYKKYFPQDICVTCCSERLWILDININIFASNKTEMLPGEKVYGPSITLLKPLCRSNNQKNLWKCFVENSELWKLKQNILYPGLTWRPVLQTKKESMRNIFESSSDIGFLGKSLVLSTHILIRAYIKNRSKVLSLFSFLFHGHV